MFSALSGFLSLPYPFKSLCVHFRSIQLPLACHLLQKGSLIIIIPKLRALWKDLILWGFRQRREQFRQCRMPQFMHISDNYLCPSLCLDFVFVFGFWYKVVLIILKTSTVYCLWEEYFKENPFLLLIHVLLALSRANQWILINHFFPTCSLYKSLDLIVTTNRTALLRTWRDLT